MENKFGKTSRLELCAGLKNEKTILKDVAFTAPFKIMHPFHEKKNVMTVIGISASAGIMEGDVQKQRIVIEDGASMEFTSQSYEKIHKMKEGFAQRNVSIEVGSKSSLYYHPLPAIPFADSALKNHVEVRLKDDTSVFVMKEILSCGRAARGERFAYRFYHNHIKVMLGDEMIYLDNTRYEPSRCKMEGFGMYEGYSHMGSLLIFGKEITDEWLSVVREKLYGNLEGGVTRLRKNAAVVRVLGNRAEQQEKLLEELLAFLRP